MLNATYNDTHKGIINIKIPKKKKYTYYNNSKNSIKMYKLI